MIYFLQLFSHKPNEKSLFDMDKISHYKNKTKSETIQQIKIYDGPQKDC